MLVRNALQKLYFDFGSAMRQQPIALEKYWIYHQYVHRPKPRPVSAERQKT